MKDKPSASFSFGPFEMTLITLVLIGLKFTVSPELPWAVALAPIWIPAALILIILGLPVVLMCLGLIAAAILGGVCIAWDFVSELWKGDPKP